MSALANNFKKNFAGLLRGLLRKVDNGDSVDPQPMPRNLLRQPTGAPQLADIPNPMASAMHTAPYQASATPSRAQNASELEMPLMTILERLPAELQAKSMLGGVNLQQATISVPVKKVLPQLALGAVKITFGELRNAAPSLFRMGEEYDSLPITLPLNEVLSRLNPGMISRNPGQRTVAAPGADIAEPFGPTGQGAGFGAPTPAQTPVQTAVQTPVAAPGIKPAPPTTHFFKKAVPSEPIKMPTPPAVAGQPLPFVPRATTPVAPAAPAPVPPPAPATPQPLPFTPRATTPAAPPTPTPRVNFNGGNGNGNGGNGGNGGGLHQSPPPPTRSNMPSSIPNMPMQRPAAPTPAPMSRPAQAPVPRPAPAPAARPAAAPVPSQEAPAIFAPLAALSEEWPESLRIEIAQLNLTNARVALPIHLIESALKRGRVIFSWHHVRSWIKPTPPGPSGHDPMELELPLKVIAPLFLPGQKQEPKPQAKADLPPTTIPNLFFGFPQPQPEELAPPVNMPEAVPLVKPLDAKLNDSNFYVWGEDGNETPHLDETEYKRAQAQAPATDFTSRRSQPKEIVDRAMKLPGVMGAIIALPDGLKVAHQLPQELNADTVAAFLPQLFSRVAQCSKELRMGELNNLNFTLGNVPWKIFRVNAVYFAAFGVGGVSLPTAQLAMLAGELDRKK